MIVHDKCGAFESALQSAEMQIAVLEMKLEMAYELMGHHRDTVANLGYQAFADSIQGIINQVQAR